ncbi:MAG: hypothetical protein LBM20_04810 [Rikenellaceae bacterium]|jgi:hypothetical protein|nr:hypothetical protein [Rikenellaceae bacterium]
MTTIVINEKTDEGRMLMNMIRAAQKSSDAVVSIDDNEVDALLNALPFAKIPGLPYTKEERIASVRQAINDYRATGESFSTEELRAKHPRI